MQLYGITTTFNVTEKYLNFGVILPDSVQQTYNSLARLMVERQNMIISLQKIQRGHQSLTLHEILGGAAALSFADKQCTCYLPVTIVIICQNEL